MLTRTNLTKIANAAGANRDAVYKAGDQLLTAETRILNACNDIGQATTIITVRVEEGRPLSRQPLSPDAVADLWRAIATRDIAREMLTHLGVDPAALRDDEQDGADATPVTLTPAQERNLRTVARRRAEWYWRHGSCAGHWSPRLFADGLWAAPGVVRALEEMGLLEASTLTDGQGHRPASLTAAGQAWIAAHVLPVSSGPAAQPAL